MTVDDVKTALDLIRIEADKGDDEVAHSKEKLLWRTVLLHVADGNEQSKELAAEALKSMDIEFSRWFA